MKKCLGGKWYRSLWSIRQSLRHLLPSSLCGILHKLCLNDCVGGSNANHKISKTHRTQHIIMFTAKIYYSKRTQSQQRKRGIEQQSRRSQEHPSESSPHGDTQDAFNLQHWTVTTHRKCCVQEKLLRNLVAGGWSHGPPLWSMYQNSQFQTSRRKVSVQHKPLLFAQTV